MHVLLIEDEAPAARRIQKLIEEYDSSITISGPIESVAQGLKWFSANPMPDLILSDIQLSDDLSFEIFKEKQIKVPIIFTTAFDQYTLESFNFYSINYLLKPIKKEELENSLLKYKEITANYTQPDFGDLLSKLQGETFRDRFLVCKRDILLTLNAKDIAYFNSEDGVTLLRTHNNQQYILNDSLDLLEASLNPKVFFRASRQYIISYESIKKVHPYFGQKLKVEVNPESPSEIIISKQKASLFKGWLNY